ncbi:MAG: glutamine synthetase type III, partial [Clostridia bacterium]|nr:glutamine synthetase type III [Clostridia bacterium]
GEVLDKKTPLLRSMEVLSKQATRVVNALGIAKCERVVAMAGAEQEYFLVDKEYARQRRDILICGRTLFGAKPQKGQELGDHYYGNIKENVMGFMRELDEQLWKLGVTAKTEHNEAAPCQHELAPVYATCNIACDHNQLIMETMKKVALRRGMVCLLHEKPFAGVNGSGKHNNWSLNIDGGKSLLRQGKNPVDDVQFLLFLASVIKAVDKYAEVLHAAIACPGNDHRLGGHEAPPAIISVFLGETLTNILENIETGGAAEEVKRSYVSMGINTIPALHADNSDRNRTSPFAFTGNKFEFRMPGASQSIADCNTVINTVVADVLEEIADRLENSSDSREEALNIIADIMRFHKRIIFNGNNYSDEWAEEARRRGLPQMNSSVDSIGGFTMEKTIAVFEKYGILSRKELESRAEIMYENYVKTINIEALTMLDMVKREIIPAVMEYQSVLADGINKLSLAGVEPVVQKDLLSSMNESLFSMCDLSDKLEKAVGRGDTVVNARDKAYHFRNEVFAAMEELRGVCDRCESVVPAHIWRLPTYSDIMYK